MKIEYKSNGNWVTANQMTWLSMTHLAGSPQTTHIAIEGGVGLGYNFMKGKDNAVCTIQGLCPWTQAGVAEYEALNGATVRITENVEGTHIGLATLTSTNGGSNGWIGFTMSFTEDSKEAY